MEIRLEECVVRLRPLEEEDLLRLEWEGGEDYRHYYREEWERHRAGTQHVLVADFRGYPIGHVAVNLEDDPPILAALRVMEPFRHAGIGSALVREAERLCRERGFRSAYIAVNPDNAEALHLYERLGYEAVGEPYETDWFITDRRGRRRRMREVVQAMARPLA